jgi:hypothetical protein
MGLGWLDLVEFLEQFACVKFSVLFGPESLNGPMDAVGVGPAEQFGQFASPVHGFSLDLNGF